MMWRAVVAAVLLATSCAAYTDPYEGARRSQANNANGGLTLCAAVERLWALRSELLSRGMGNVLSSWQCPFGLRACNPCGIRSGSDNSWGWEGGGWQHIACRTYDMVGDTEFAGMWRSDMNVSRMGVVTNIHITDLKIPGTLSSLDKGAARCLHCAQARELSLRAAPMQRYARSATCGSSTWTARS